MRRYTYDEIILMLKRHQGERTQRELAVDIGCSESYLSELLTGQKHEPGEKILTYLGLNEVKEYVKQE